MKQAPTNPSTVISSKPFAEVIESSLHGFLAQSWEWNRFPIFGSLVSVQSDARTLCGIVHQVQTGSMDPVRYPFAYQKTEVELMAEQPQIFEFLKTTFNALIIGYQERGVWHYLSAPQPAKIHAFVQPMPLDLCKTFLYRNQYLHVLFSLQNQLCNLDELLLALIKHQSALGIMHEEKILSFINTFCLLAGNDYRRLKLFLQRVQPLVESAIDGHKSLKD